MKTGLGNVSDEFLGITSLQFNRHWFKNLESWEHFWITTRTNSGFLAKVLSKDKTNFGTLLLLPT